MLNLPHWLMIAGALLVVSGLIGALATAKKAEKVEPPSDERAEASGQQLPPLPSLLESKSKTSA